MKISEKKTSVINVQVFISEKSLWQIKKEVGGSSLGANGKYVLLWDKKFTSASSVGRAPFRQKALDSNDL